MAGNTSDSVNYYLRLPLIQKQLLGALRHWDNVKIAYDANDIWLKDLDAIQSTSIEVKTIPEKQIYYAHNGKLFREGSILPDQNIPSLLWTPLVRGLQLSLPAFNHNHFGLHDKIDIKMIAVDNEQLAFAAVVSLVVLKAYIADSPAIRTKDLQWTIVNNDALITGVPLLPLPGKVLWRRDDHLLPAGYDLELHSLSKILNEMINPSGNHWIKWTSDGDYSLIPKSKFTRLTRASFQLTETE